MQTNAPNGAATHAPATTDVMALKRRIYLTYLAVTTGGLLALWLTSPDLTEGQQRLTNIVTPLTFVLTVLCFVTLWRNPRSIRPIEVVLYGLCYPVILGALVLNLAFATNMLEQQAALASFSNWMPLAFIWAYLVFGSRRGIYAAGAFLATGLAVLAPFGLSTRLGYQELVTLSLLGEITFSASLYIVALFGLAYLLERQTSARVSAETTAELAYVDTLTNLPNRLGLQTRLEQAVALAARNQETLAVFFIDLDGFKRINDSYGHQGGDLLLQQFAQRLKSSVRASDTVARMSGDEFVVVAFLTDTEQARTLADKLLEVYHAPFTLDGHGVAMTGSIGVSLYPGDGLDSDTLLLHADSAMYHAKAAGKNRWSFYTASSNAARTERLDLATPLRHAIERQQLDVDYQPFFDLQDKSLVGIEALARWRHPELGEIPPSVFIPVAERHNLIIPLGTWMLEMACRQAKAWQSEGLAPVRVSVNVSAAQFADADFVDVVKRVLNDNQLAPKWLSLELTESCLVQASAAPHLNALRALGVHVSLDDFGTGYSSLAQLQALPLDSFKIDRAFLSALHSPRDSTKNAMVLLETIVTLASGLGLSVVAEGVETEEQESLLRQIGCEVAQGFLFAKPATAEEIGQLLTETVKRARS